MALTFWDPFSMLSRLDREFDDLVRRTWGGSGTASTAGYVPAVEMATDGEDVLLRLELPGVDVEKDVDIEVAEGQLTVSGRRADRYESGNGKGQVLVRELRYGQFRRDFALPEGVTADDVDASYDRGMLEVRVRRVAKQVASPKKVAIKAAAQPRIIEPGKADS
jgi:HSP20 family protein